MQWIGVLSSSRLILSISRSPDTVTHWGAETLEDVLDGDDENDAGDSNINNRTQRVICKAAFIAYYARNMDESVSSHDAGM